jgi:gliding motility-associated-like protein
MLIMTDTAACKSPDTVTHVISFLNQVVSAKFSIPDSICLGTSFTPNVLFTNINSTKWTFGDGQTSLLGDPTHLYTAVGSYTVTLVALNTTGCGGGDTLTEYIKVLPVPTANFSVEPTVPIPNVPNKFTNLSVNATRYRWDFGDALTSEEVNPVHQYNKTGVYKPCLTAYNASNCPSKVCKEATADVEPLIGLPTAFSPNGDGENDILYVRGAAISTMDLKIFNRWGQLVFESNSLQKGWDGTFNGQPQPMEAYAYVLNASFIDGTAKMMKGNITLLR